LIKFVDTVLQLSCVFYVLVWYVSDCAGARLLHVQFYLRLLYTHFPHLRCLHADSITRAIHMMYFTRYFLYLRNPYPQFHYTRIKSTYLSSISGSGQFLWRPAWVISPGYNYLNVQKLTNDISVGFGLWLGSEPVEGPPVLRPRSGDLTYTQGPNVTYGKNFLGACRCMTVVVL